MRMAASGGLRVRNFTGKCELCKLLGILLVGIGVVVLLFSLPGLVVGFSPWHNAHRVGLFCFCLGEMSAGVAEIAICNALLCMNDSAYISTGNLKDTEVPFPSWL